MDQAHPLHPFAYASFGQEVDVGLFQQAGANAIVDMLVAASLQHDGIDAIRWSRWESISPAGPPPTMPTCVRWFISVRHIFQMHTITCGFGSDPPLRVALFRQKMIFPRETGLPDGRAASLGGPRECRVRMINVHGLCVTRPGARG